MLYNVFIKIKGAVVVFRTKIDAPQPVQGVIGNPAIGVGVQIGPIGLSRLVKGALRIIQGLKGIGLRIEGGVPDIIADLITQCLIIMFNGSLFTAAVIMTITQVIFQTRLIPVGNRGVFKSIRHYTILQHVKEVQKNERASVPVMNMPHVLLVQEYPGHPHTK